MKPYYQDPFCTIYHGDCREILPTIQAFDLLLTDPPYGIFKNTNSNGVMFGKETIYTRDQSATEWDKRPDKSVIDLILSKADRYVIWGGNYMADMIGPCKGPLIWNKLTGNNSYADGEAAWANITGTMRIFTHQWCGAFKASERGYKAVHPTQKPVALMRWCISLAGHPQTILDPFMGSGTTLRAAKDMLRHATGIEIEEQYCEIAAKRLQQEVFDFGKDESEDEKQPKQAEML